MASEYYKPTTPGVRHRTRSKQKLSKTKLIKKLRRINKNYAGRNNSGKITIRHRGGRQKRFLRLIDFKRDAFEIPAKVNTIEYDPNRSANIALLHYQNGDKRYIIAPDGLRVGQTVISSKENAEIEPGNTLPLNKIPVGTPIHNLELTPGKGGQIIRSAGAAAYIQDKEDRFVSIKLPSGEIRRFPAISMATIGQVSNPDHKNRKLGKAGRRRLMGWRPSVRGVAMHPGAHPHGGGEGRSGIGMKSPKSPWGNRTLGKKTRKVKKYSTKDIIKDRRSKNN
jgi:large subunit ribosomal protein L2